MLFKTAATRHSARCSAVPGWRPSAACLGIDARALHLRAPGCSGFKWSSVGLAHKFQLRAQVHSRLWMKHCPNPVVLEESEYTRSFPASVTFRTAAASFSYHGAVNPQSMSNPEHRLNGRGRLGSSACSEGKGARDTKPRGAVPS